MTTEATTTTPEPQAPRPERTEGEAPRPRRTIVPKARRPRGVAVNDPVGDMLTRIRNAAGARHDTVMIPSSRMKIEIARILKAEGFIGGYRAEAPRERGATKEGEVAPPGTQLGGKRKDTGGKTPAALDRP